MEKKQHDKKTWFVLGAVFFVFAALLVLILAVPKGVDMEAVLTGRGLGLGDEPLILLSVFAATLGTISLAKGYEILKKEKLLAQKKKARPPRGRKKRNAKH